MTDLSLDQWQSQNCFLSPMPPLGTLQEEQAQWVQGWGPHTPTPPPFPSSFTTASTGWSRGPPGPFGPGQRGRRDRPGILHVLPSALTSRGPFKTLPGGCGVPAQPSSQSPHLPPVMRGGGIWGRGPAPERGAGRAYCLLTADGSY